LSLGQKNLLHLDWVLPSENPPIITKYYSKKAHGYAGRLEYLIPDHPGMTITV
jgi:hypothetical protein